MVRGRAGGRATRDPWRGEGSGELLKIEVGFGAGSGKACLPLLIGRKIVGV